MAGILLIFLLGGMLGSLGTYIFMKERFLKMIQGPPGMLIPRFIGKLERKLDLSPEQKIAVNKNAEALREELNTFMEKNRPDAEEIVNRHILSIKSVLNPAQQKEMDRIQERMQKRWMHHRGKRHKDVPRRRGYPEKILSRLQHRLDLRADQTEKLRPFLADFWDKRPHSYRDRDCGEKNNFFREWWKCAPELTDELEKILTPEQMAVFQEYRDENCLQRGGGQF